MCQSASNNSKKDIPAAACNRCGGWTSFGGMSQHSQRTTPVMGRTGCDKPFAAMRMSNGKPFPSH